MTLIPHLPVLQIVLPLIGAPICTVLGGRRLAWAFALLFCGIALAISVMLLIQVQAGGTIRYDIGNWVPPYGIEYRVDALSSIVLVIVAAIATTVLVYSRASVEAEIPAAQHRYFYTAYLLAVTGLLGMTVTGDAFNVFVFLEISSLATYVLIALGRHRRALYAAYQYLILGTIGATFYVIGIGLLYMMTGTLNMDDLAARLAPLHENRVVLAAFAFLVAGLGLKVAMFPLHLWLPKAYTYAPSAVSALLAATATKVGLYVMIRVLFGIFGADYAFAEVPLGLVLVALGSIAAIAGSLVAVFQDEVKRLLAYSSVAQIGYIILGIGLASHLGLTAATVHLFNHAVMKGALFLVAGCWVYSLGSAQFSQLAGVGRRMPLVTAAFVVGGLGMIGVPGTVGFVSKWYLLQGAVSAEMWPAVVAIVISSLLAVAYVWKVVEVAYFQPAPADVAGVPRAGRTLLPLSMLVPTLLLTLAGIYFGLDTRLPLGMAQAASDLMLGGTP